MDFAAYFKAISAGIGGLVGYLYGGWTTTLYVLVAFVSIDYVTGIIAAASERKLDPTVGFVGVAKKLFIFIMVAIGHLLDLTLNLSVIQQAAIFYYLGTEFISINKNFGRLGVPVPEVISKAIENFPQKAAIPPVVPVTDKNDSQGGGTGGK